MACRFKVFFYILQKNVAPSLPQAVIHGRERKEKEASFYEVVCGLSSFRKVPERKARRRDASAVPMEVRLVQGAS